MKKLTLTILVGNIGAGKSTLADKMVEDEQFGLVSYDSISKMFLGGQHRLRGAAHAKLCKAAYEYLIYESLNQGISVVADDLNLRVSDRKYLCDIGKSFGANIVAVDFGCGKIEDLERRAGASDTFNYQGFDFMFQDYKSRYQKPTTSEGFSVVLKGGA